jgi:hypothetical protein
MVWVWLRLRYTRYRDAAVLLLTIILLYAIVVAAEMYVSEDAFQGRYLRYAGILFFLLLLMAVDQWRVPLVKGLLCAVVIVLGFCGLRYYATRAYGPMAGYYDPMTKISHDISPAILEYLRSEATRHNFQRPIAVIASPAAALSLPRFRFLTGPGAGCVDGWEMASWRCDGRWMGYTGGATWMGRAEKIFVVLPEKMLLNGKAEAALRLFTGYEFDNWKHTNLDGMIIYTQ